MKKLMMLVMLLVYGGIGIFVEGAQEFARGATELKNKPKQEVLNDIQAKIEALQKREQYQYETAEQHKKAWDASYKRLKEAENLRQYISDLTVRDSKPKDGFFSKEQRTMLDQLNKDLAKEEPKLKEEHQEVSGQQPARSERYKLAEEGFKKNDGTKVEGTEKLKKEIWQELSPLEQKLDALSVKLTESYEPWTTYDRTMNAITQYGKNLAMRAKALFNEVQIKVLENFGEQTSEKAQRVDAMRDELVGLYGLLGDEVNALKTVRPLIEKQLEKDAQQRLNEHVNYLKVLSPTKDINRKTFNQELQKTAELIIETYAKIPNALARTAVTEKGKKAAQKFTLGLVEFKEHPLDTLVNELRLLGFEQPKEYVNIEAFVDETFKPTKKK